MTSRFAIQKCLVPVRFALATVFILMIRPASGQDMVRKMYRDYSSAITNGIQLECPESIPLGIQLQFTGTFTNEGNTTISNVTFTVNVSNHLSMSNFTTTQGTWTEGAQMAVLNMGAVGPGVTVTFTFVMTTLELGTATLASQFSGDSQESCDIEIIPPVGQIIAEKFNDLNGNGEKDDGEPPIMGWEFFLDEDGNATFDEGERTAATNASGLATFDNVPLGSYGLFEVDQPGWVRTLPPTGYLATLGSPGESLQGSFGNYQYPLYDQIATTSDQWIFRPNDRFGDPMPDGTFDFGVTDVTGDYDYSYLNVFIDFNRDGMIASYPVSKDVDQLEWVARNVPLPGSGGLMSSPAFSAWFPMPDMSISVGVEYDYVVGITYDPLDVPDGVAVGMLQVGGHGTAPLMGFQWGANDPEGQDAEAGEEPEPESTNLPDVTFVDFIPGPNDPGGMPDITQKFNECGPTSAANSLIWLAQKHDFSERLPQKDGEVDQDQLILDLMQAMAGNQNRPFGGLNDNQLFDGKKKYIQEKGLPLVVEGGNTDDNAKNAKTFEFIQNEISKGQDVELLVKWPGPGAHWVTISGYAVSSDGKAVLFVHDPDDGKTAEVVWELEVNESNQITGKVTSPSQSRMLWAVAESPVENIGVEDEPGVPQTFELFENYPNPFETATTIAFSLPKHTHVVLRVYDLLGRSLKTLADGEYGAGLHTIEFDARDLGSGTYIYELDAGGFKQTRSMTVAK